MSDKSVRYSGRSWPGTALRRSLGAVLLLCACLVAPVQAVYVQDPLDGGDAILTSFGTESADDFVLAADAEVTGVRWWGSLDFPNFFADTFNVRIYEDGGGVPNATPLAEYTGVGVTRTATALFDIVQAPVYQFDFLLPASLSLSAGTSYYLGLESTDQNGGFYWLQSADSVNDANFFRTWFGPYPNVDPWAADVQTFDLAFELLGTSSRVPEPASALLLPLGLIAARRRQRTRCRA